MPGEGKVIQIIGPVVDIMPDDIEINSIYQPQLEVYFTREEIETLYAEGHFPPGSMGPKIEAVVHFLKQGGRRALITDPDNLPLAMEGRAGTHFIGKL